MPDCDVATESYERIIEWIANGQDGGNDLWVCDRCEQIYVSNDEWSHEVNDEYLCTACYSGLVDHIHDSLQDR